MDSPFDPKSPVVQEILKRSISDQSKIDQMKPTPEEAPVQAHPISPKLALLGGSLADSVSTYKFLRHGSQETNPALQYFNGHPNRVIPSAIGGALGYTLLYNLLHKNHPQIADVLAGQVGGLHASLAGNNFHVDGTRQHGESLGTSTQVSK